MTAENHMAAEGIETDFNYTPAYRDLEDVQSINEYMRDKLIEPGEYSRDTEVGFIGSKAFYVHDEESVGTNVTGAMMADVLMDEIGIEGPEIFYDKEEGKVLVGELPGVPTTDYRATSPWKMAKHMLGRELEGDREKVDRAIGLKYFLGDSDIAPNIVVTEASAVPIDYDRTGEQSIKGLEEAKEHAEEVYSHFNWEFDGERFESVLEDISRNVDVEDLEEEFTEVVSEAPENSRRKDYFVKNSIENIWEFR
jgi:hypothetical protein